MTASPPRSLLLDASALSLLSAGEAAIGPWAAYARRVDAELYLSTATLVETTDGSARDARVRQTLHACLTVPVSEEIGFSAGTLRARAAGSRRKPRDLTVDAIVAATALSLQPPVAVLTGDPKDLRLLLQDTAVRVEAIN